MDKKVNKQASPWFLSSRTTLKTPSRCWYAAKANERWRTNNPRQYQINIYSLELYRKTLITNLDTSNILSMFTNMNISKSEYKKILPKLIYLYQNETTQ